MHVFTRQSLKVDPRGQAIPNLLHPYLLLSRTDRARVTKTENGHKTDRQGTDFDDNLVAHLSEGVLGRSG